MKSPLLDNLNNEQEEAVRHSLSPLLILAGAGSGKTRVITTKIAYLIKYMNVAPESILAVTFTNKAAREMKERAINLEPRAQNVMIKTFHSFGAWFLRRNAHIAGIDANFTIYDDDDVKKLLEAVLGKNRGTQLGLYAHLISRAKDYLLDKDTRDFSKLTPDPSFSDIYRDYEERKSKTGNVDFGDLIKIPTEILQKESSVRKRIQERFSVILVDEYQDSNIAQFELLKMLTGPNTYICVVGDDDQSIYKFRGAEVKNILSFPNIFANTKIIKLEKNYRSTAHILSIASHVVAHNEGRLGKTLVPVREQGKKPILVGLESAEDEASFCANIICDHVRKGGHYQDIAILYRTNAQSLTFETDFVRKSIPFRIVGALRFFDREEVKDTLSLLAFIMNPKDEVAFGRIINKPARGIGETSIAKIKEYADFNHSNYLESTRKVGPTLSKKAKIATEDFCSFISEVSQSLENAKEDEKITLAQLLDYVIEKSGLLAFHKAQDEIQGSQKEGNLFELVNSSSLYPYSIEGLSNFLEAVELDRSMQNEETLLDAVTLITMHNTKGLEFPIVIATGIEYGIFPRPSDDEEEVEEQRRLFYVAITRAKDMLYLTYARRRRIRGQYEDMIPSPFINELPPENIDGFMPKKTIRSKFNQGDYVYHDEYGPGVVTKTQVSSDGLTVVFVHFENGGIMRFLPQFAKKLEKISE